jgi:predicted methyltransferase
LPDPVSTAILKHIVDTGGCTWEDILDIDAVTKESESCIERLRDYGLLEITGGEVKITKKGIKMYEELQGLTKGLEE